MNTRIARSVAKALRDLPGEWDSFNMYEWLRDRHIHIRHAQRRGRGLRDRWAAWLDGRWQDRRVAGRLPGGAGQQHQGQA